MIRVGGRRATVCVYVCASERDKITCTQRVAPSGWRQERVKVTGTGKKKTRRT